MGPTKAIIKDQALYEAATGKCIKDGFASRRDIEDYVNHHYLALPVVDNAGNAWRRHGTSSRLRGQRNESYLYPISGGKPRIHRSIA